MNASPLAIALLSAVTADCFAADGSLVGLPAPAFAADCVLDPTRSIDSTALLGEVILLKFWGTT